MLLSRVAERLYWAARYLERAEGTARIVREHSNVIVDLPLSVTPAWDHLLGITGDREGFDKRYDSSDETSIVSFLVADSANPGSVRSSIAQARENLQTCRDILPVQAWNAVNDSVPRRRDAGPTDGVQRRYRSRFLEKVIAEHQRLLGILTSTMSRDEAYTLLRLGRHIERGDMVTRVLDVRAGLLLSERAERAELYDDLQWSSVLRSLSALQMYNRRSIVGDRSIRGDQIHPRGGELPAFGGVLPGRCSGRRQEAAAQRIGARRMQVGPRRTGIVGTRRAARPR